MRRAGWRTAALVALVFASGLATGVLASRAMQQRRLRELVLGDPAALRTELMLHALDRRIGLSETQHAEAARILRAQEEAYREALEGCRPEIRRLRRELAAELGPRLDPAQRSGLEELIREGERFR